MPHPEDIDEETRRRAQQAQGNRLASYFGGAQPPAATGQAQQPGSDTPRAVAAQAPPATSSPVWQAGQQAAMPPGVGGSPNTGSQPQQMRRPGPTGFTNFSRYAAANRGVSQREAGTLAGQAQRLAEQAAARRQALQQRFGGELAAGTVGAPGMGSVAGANAGVGPTRPELGGGLSSEEQLKRAGGQYTGPGGLTDVEGYDDVEASKLAAEGGLDALADDAGIRELLRRQHGDSSKLSAGLVGSAGRGQFDALRSRFTPASDLDAANKQAAAQAQTAREISAANAAKWGASAQAKKTEEANAKYVAEQRAKAAGEKKAADEKKLRDDAKWQADFAEAQKGTAGVKSVFEQIDPLNWFGGGKRGPGMDFLGKTFGEDYKGNIQWEDNADDMDVYSQMDAKQWNQLAGLTALAQRNWINRRAAELKNKTGPARGTFVSHRDT